MADHNVRVSMHFDNIDNYNVDFHEKVLYLIDKNVVRTVEEVAKDVLKKFLTVSQDIKAKPAVEFFVNDCFVPKWEDVSIFRENDEVKVRQKHRSREHKKSKKRKECEMLFYGTDSSIEKTKRRRAEISGASDNELHDVSTTLTKKHHLKKHKKEKKLKTKEHVDSDSGICLVKELSTQPSDVSFISHNERSNHLPVTSQFSNVLPDCENTQASNSQASNWQASSLDCIEENNSKEDPASENGSALITESCALDENVPQEKNKLNEAEDVNADSKTRKRNRRRKRKRTRPSKQSGVTPYLDWVQTRNVTSSSSEILPSPLQSFSNTPNVNEEFISPNDAAIKTVTQLSNGYLGNNNHKHITFDSDSENECTNNTLDKAVPQGVRNSENRTQDTHLTQLKSSTYCDQPSVGSDVNISDSSRKNSSESEATSRFVDKGNIKQMAESQSTCFDQHTTGKDSNIEQNSEAKKGKISETKDNTTEIETVIETKAQTKSGFVRKRSSGRLQNSLAKSLEFCKNEFSSHDIMPENASIIEPKLERPAPSPVAVYDLVSSKAQKHLNGNAEFKLIANAQVFDRRKHKRKGSFPLSQAMELSHHDVYSNKSFVFENSEPSQGVLINDVEQTSTNSFPKNDEAHERGAEKKKENEDQRAFRFGSNQYSTGRPKSPPPKDYSPFPALYGAPRVGDAIAYKVLEMGEDYTPGMSDYKEAKVLKFDPNSQMLSLEIVHCKGMRKRGRFHCELEDESEILTVAREFIGQQVELPLTSLLEAKLIS